MKKLIILFVSIVLLTSCSIDDDNKNIYKIDLNNDPYNVCGKTIYFSDDAYNDKLDIRRIIETITTACNVKGANLAKEEIYDILTDDDYTIQDIYYHLRDAYNYLDK